MAATGPHGSTKRTRTGVKAAALANERDSVRFVLPLAGQLRLPSPDTLAFVAAVALLAAFELVEWPVAVAITVGHTLAHTRQSRTLEAFGEALEEA